MFQQEISKVRQNLLAAEERITKETGLIMEIALSTTLFWPLFALVTIVATIALWSGIDNLLSLKKYDLWPWSMMFMIIAVAEALVEIGISAILYMVDIKMIFKFFGWFGSQQEERKSNQLEMKDMS